MITVVDYGMGNLGSILNLCRYLDIPARATSKAEEIATAGKLILPGVGSFDAATAKIDALEFRAPILQAAIDRKVPLLGICLGMQLLGIDSEEGLTRGLGLINAHTRRITTPAGATARLLTPHMGWNTVKTSGDAKLFAGLPTEPRFYFVHSYHVVCDDTADTVATVSYGRMLTAAVQHGNVFGTQFHPEKSHRYGMQVMRNFHAL